MVRKLIVETIAKLESCRHQELRAGFVTLILSEDSLEPSEVETLARRLLEIGCNEFCILCSNANEIHDGLDRMLEDDSRFDVPTSDFETEDDALEYFLFGSGAGMNDMLALVTNDAAARDIRARIISASTAPLVALD